MMHGVFLPGPSPIVRRTAARTSGAGLSWKRTSNRLGSADHDLDLHLLARVFPVYVEVSRLYGAILPHRARFLS